LTQQLRLGLFEGLIVTDALVMGAIANYGASESWRLEAGATFFALMRSRRAIQAVCEAVTSGRISQSRSCLSRAHLASQLKLRREASENLRTTQPHSPQLQIFALNSGGSWFCAFAFNPDDIISRFSKVQSFTQLDFGR